MKPEEEKSLSEEKQDFSKYPIPFDLVMWGLTAEDMYEVANSMGITLTEVDMGKIADLFSESVDWWETLVFAIKQIKDV